MDTFLNVLKVGIVVLVIGAVLVFFTGSLMYFFGLLPSMQVGQKLDAMIVILIIDVLFNRGGKK